MLSKIAELESGPQSPTEHAVRFYEKDQQLLDEVGGFLEKALRAGGHALVIGTAHHRAALTQRLDPRNAPDATFSGRLLMLDAAETLDRFMVDGHPDRQRFESFLVPILQRAGKPLHAFGEMVALLCEAGNYEGALELEVLWNGLVRRHRFSLFCGYPWRLFSSNERARAFQHVCAAHGTVINGDEAEATGSILDPARTLAQLQQHALALQTEVQRRREAERSLRQRERELADFLDNASEGIHKVAADGTILYANRAELDMLGYRWDEYVGRSIADFYPQRQQIDSILERLKRGEVLRDEPALMRCKDGSCKPVLIYSNGFFDKGQLVYTRCFTRDASERVARDQALEQRNGVIMQAPVGAALLTGPELRHELANDAYCRILGRTDIVGNSFAQAFPELAGTEAERALHEALRTGQCRSVDEFRHVISEGAGKADERFCRMTLQPLRAPSGDALGVIAVAVDVTEQVRARQELERSSIEREQLLVSLREASRAKDEFLAMLGHELRNPLSPIVTALQLMRLRGETGTESEQAIIQRQVDHLVRLVDDLLDISRITRGLIELKRERCELATVISKAVEQASVLMEQKRHVLRIETEPDLCCEGDAVRLAQVVANLLTNAARYTAPGGDIRLRAWRDTDERLAISVRDNGRGIAAGDMDRIFDLFYQDERGIDRARGGLGIGLALVRSLVALHRGTVEAFSEGPGRGSEFVVRLPAVEPSAASEATAARVQSLQGPLTERRILLVDDNRDAVEMLGELLRQMGHSVRAFTDPVAALSAAPLFKPELAVLDIGLPVMDGYELAGRIREACGDSCMLVALTGYGQESDRERARAAGFHAHFVKPVSQARLLEVIQSAQ